MIRWVTGVVVLSLMVSPDLASAQAITYTGTVQAGAANAKYYRFELSESGQFLATLSWDNGASLVGVVVSCDPSDPTIYGLAAAGLDRFARLESGIDGPQTCLIGVASINIIAAYRLNVQLASGKGTVAPLVLREVGRQTGGLIDARLIEEAERAFTQFANSRR